MKAGFFGVTESMLKAVSPNRFKVTREFPVETGISSMVRGRVDVVAAVPAAGDAIVFCSETSAG